MTKRVAGEVNEIIRCTDALVQSLLTVAIIGLGVLIGLALAVLVHGIDIGGVAPLFANAIGAAIGAGITLWAAERRSQQSVKKAFRTKLLGVVARFATILIHAKEIQRALKSQEIDTLAINAVRALEESLSHSSEMLDVLLEAELTGDFSSVTISFTHIRRILSDLPREGARLREHLNENSDEYARDFEFLGLTVQQAYGTRPVEAAESPVDSVSRI